MPGGGYVLEYLYGEAHEAEPGLAKRKDAAVPVGDRHLRPFPRAPCAAADLVRVYARAAPGAPGAPAGEPLLTPEEQGQW